jgi:hypothetical protein
MTARDLARRDISLMKGEIKANGGGSIQDNSSTETCDEKQRAVFDGDMVR